MVTVERMEGLAQDIRGQGPLPASVRPRKGGIHVSGSGQPCGLHRRPEGQRKGARLEAGGCAAPLRPALACGPARPSAAPALTRVLPASLGNQDGSSKPKPNQGQRGYHLGSRAAGRTPVTVPSLTGPTRIFRCLPLLAR